MLRSLRALALFGALTAIGMVWAAPSAAQVTTGVMRGTVTDSAGNPIDGVRVTATHVPSGTVYQAMTRADGRFTLPGMRVGGPYTVEATRIGLARQSRDNLTVTLGVSTDVLFQMGAVATALTAVTVTSTGGEFSTTRTGAATTVPSDALERLPTISRRIDDFTRLTPQASGSSFAGMDNRLNNITVDGSYFNNSFGLAGQPGDRTGVAPISIDAIEAVQVNIAPFDVRQGNFVGASVNTVTKSGTNDFSGSVYFNTRDESLVGTRVGGRAFNPGTFDFKQFGGRLGGPIIKNKLFFFVSYETDGLEEPGTTWQANPSIGPAPLAPVTGQMTRVRASTLDSLSNYLLTNFNYATGPYEGYTHETPSSRLTAKIDFALNDRSKFILRYTELSSDTDVLLSNSSSLGFGNRRTNPNGLNFQNSNYQIMENISSLVGEWNTLIGSNMANNLIVGYTKNDESRASRGSFFPMVDVLEGSSVFTTFGFEPFTPSNELRYNSTQLQNNFTIYGDRHDLTFGVSWERYESENVFFPGSQSVYVYNSLADFYTDANGYLANPTRTTSPVTLRRFQVRWSNIPGQTKPIQPLEVTFAGAYAQDEWRFNDDLTLTLGLRVDAPKFGDTGFENTQVDAMNFRDEKGNTVQYSTKKLPDSKLLFSPRLGVNWDVTGDGVTQVRGGTGVFTGRPAYVWISNQIGNNGVLTGFESVDNTTARPFNPNPDHYKPTTVTGAPAVQYELAFTDKDFKFPQQWRTNLAIDRKLPWELTGTVEWMFGKDVNGVYYIDANQSTPDGNFSGPDNRPRWFTDDCPTTVIAGQTYNTGTQQRLNCFVTSAIVLKNQNIGSNWNIAASLERSFSGGFYAKAAYSYGWARNTVDPGSIAFGSWNNNQHVYGPNNPGAGFSGNSLGHRYFVVASYTRNILPIGPTGLSVFLDSRTTGNGSYVFGGDMNGDGGTSNDLIYIPKNMAEMNFLPITSGATTLFTPAQQQLAFENFIMQDRYLRNNRGKYAERGAVWMPMTTRMDLSLTQDIVRSVGGKPNRLQMRMDILNFTNLLNSDWGRSYNFVSTSPLVPAGVDAQNRPQYRMRTVGSSLLSRSFQRSSGTSDVFRIQLGIRYTFN
jgi:outer membrane receptor protein involved in Fe transport